MMISVHFCSWPVSVSPYIIFMTFRRVNYYFFACFDRAIFLHFLPPPPPPPSPPPHSPRDEMGRPSLKQGLQYLVPVGSILRKSTEKRITVTKLRNFKTKSFPRPSDS